MNPPPRTLVAVFSPSPVLLFIHPRRSIVTSVFDQLSPFLSPTSVFAFLTTVTLLE